jgi:RimJ/RimL family protein N-acetyltransferase
MTSGFPDADEPPPQDRPGIRSEGDGVMPGRPERRRETGPGMKVLETERLVLRRLTIGDAAFILRLVNEPLWLRHIGDRGIRTLDDARRYILEGPTEMYARAGHGLYQVELKTSGEPVGICGLLRRESLEDADLGFALLAEFHGRGYAFESASAVMGREARALGLSRVVALTSPDNHVSAALLEKLGYRFERPARLGPDGAEVRLFAAAIASSVLLARAYGLHNPAAAPLPACLEDLIHPGRTREEYLAELSEDCQPLFSRSRLERWIEVSGNYLVS